MQHKYYIQFSIGKVLILCRRILQKYQYPKQLVLLDLLYVEGRDACGVKGKGECGVDGMREKIFSHALDKLIPTNFKNDFFHYILSCVSRHGFCIHELGRSRTSHTE